MIFVYKLIYLLSKPPLWNSTNQNLIRKFNA